MIIKASLGKVFRRKIDGLIFGNEIHLGVDYSTGVARPDLPEYYEEVDDDSDLPDSEVLDIILDRNETN